MRQIRLLNTPKFIFAVLFLFVPWANASEQLRIISLAPSSTEMLFALGVGESVVGVDNFSNYPATANSLPKLGDFKGVSIEAIIALRPTHLVLLDNFLPAESMDKLKRLGITPLVCNNRNIVDVKSCALVLGKAFQRKREGEAIAERIDFAQRSVRKTGASRAAASVLIIVETEPLYAMGPRNFMHELFVDAGFKNVLEKSAAVYPMISHETLLASRPDVVVTFRPKFETDLKAFFERANFRNRPPIVVLDEEVFTRSGPRVVEAYQTLEKLNAQLKSSLVH